MERTDQITLELFLRKDGDGIMKQVSGAELEYLKKENILSMALTAMHKTQNEWAMDFLKRNLKFEESQKIRTTIYHILNDYDPGSVVARGAGKQVEYVILAKN